MLKDCTFSGATIEYVPKIYYLCTVKQLKTITTMEIKVFLSAKAFINFIEEEMPAEPVAVQKMAYTLVMDKLDCCTTYYDAAIHIWYKKTSDGQYIVCF